MVTDLILYEGDRSAQAAERCLGTTVEVIRNLDLARTTARPYLNADTLRSRRR